MLIRCKIVIGFVIYSNKIIYGLQFIKRNTYIDSIYIHILYIHIIIVYNA